MLLCMTTKNVDVLRAARQRYYQKHKEAIKAKVADWRLARPDRVKAHEVARKVRWEAKLAEQKDKPCADCGVKYPPRAMDFAVGPSGTQEIVCLNCQAVRGCVKGG